MKRSAGLALGIALVAAACTGSSEDSASSSSTAPATTVADTAATSTTTPDDPRDPVVDPESHTVASLGSVDDFERLGTAGIGDQTVLKFSITEFTSDPEIVWLDSNFYTLHDEWYWYQLLNGTAVRGFDTEPVEGESFDTIAELYDWADENRSQLPLDLRFTNLERLYSPDFYDIALDASDGRRIGLGALIRTPDPDTGDDRWVIELEFSDEVTPAQMETYFTLVGGSVPDSIAEHLQWVPRSRPQEVTATAIEAADGNDRDRIVRYDELSRPGDTQVYSPGIAAGRLLVITEGGRWSLADAGPNDIVAIDRAPDDLPAGNGLITGTPQTPLAHVNVLAVNRGIPNAFLAGLADDPTLSQLGRVRAPVLVQATDSGELEVIPLTSQEYEGWQATQGRTRVSVPDIDLAIAPYTRTLDSIDPAIPATELGWLRPLIGGKAAGFVELATPSTVTTPPDAMVITVRAYREHEAMLAEQIDAVLRHASLESSVRSRYLLLEGRNDYDERFTSTADAALADDFIAENADSVLGTVIAADGLRRMFRDRPIDPDTLTALSDEVEANFAAYSPQQGLRFRSSSSVEDIEGFNGAGLYDSNTGYLDPTVLPDEDDHKRTVERAILRTWSSFWSANAFEERRRENIDHRSGAMAVLVHARFDDDLELANGVATFTLNPEPGVTAVMDVNTQAGAVSVTNATVDDGESPEIVTVTESADGIARPAGIVEIERVASSSLSPDDPVLDDAELIELFNQLSDVAGAWLARANDELPEGQRSSTLRLDFEFRLMDAGWPARADGRIEPSRMIVKQGRTLDPGLRGIPQSIVGLPIPRDVLAHASEVVEIDCSVGGDEIVGVSVTRDPLAPVQFNAGDFPFGTWIIGFSEDPNGCDERPLFTTPQQYLHDLLDSR